MKNHFSGCLILLLLIAGTVTGQISHGGKPLPYSAVFIRSTSGQLFQNMPSFDLQEELYLDSLNNTGLRGGYKFAYKFMTDFTPANSGIHFTTDDGVKVWRLGIRSENALSINVLFSEYELPEGAQLFLYNSDQSYVLGSFNHLNNSELGVFPVSPVPGEELIIEYQEPPGVAFSGRIAVGEVNHDYRGFKGAGPLDDETNSINRINNWCMPNVNCYSEDEIYNNASRSVVLIIVDGIYYCTAVLVNNTSNDRTPYLLTASHCLNENFKVNNPDYMRVAGSIICFFNYNSPFCDLVRRGTQEQSMASTKCIAVNERSDMALLELLEIPPAYYQPYYSGWNTINSGDSPYFGIHHPGGSVKRINFSNSSLAYITITPSMLSGTNFYNNAHWHLKEWKEGSTAGGSSGSPLLDKNGHIVGLLSGGSSYCSTPVNDYYYALSVAWNRSARENEQLEKWLDPEGTGKTICEGLDPYDGNACIRLSNILSPVEFEDLEIASFSGINTGNMFGVNSLGSNVYAEKYTCTGTSIIYGTYMVTPSVSEKDLQVEVKVFTDNNGPEQEIYSEKFYPTFIHWNTATEEVENSVKDLNRVQESFVFFETPVTIEGDFYLGYSVDSDSDQDFAVYNLKNNRVTDNTAWLCYNDNWQEAISHPLLPVKTSLFINPVVRSSEGNGSSNEKVEEEPVNILVLMGHDKQMIHIILPKEDDKAEVSLYSITGRLEMKNNIEGRINTIPVSLKSKGVYVVQIKCGNIYYTQKLIF